MPIREILTDHYRIPLPVALSDSTHGTIEAFEIAPGRYRHDFRRTAVRNMERRGVPRSVAMKITGHRTESVYRRYAIVSDADLREAARKLTGTITGIVANSEVDRQQ
jgi:integrase